MESVSWMSELKCALSVTLWVRDCGFIYAKKEREN